jgi:hypothetical protein
MNNFFLGAGFSRHAGLPLGDGLWTEILETAKSKGLYEGLKHPIYEYLMYYHGKTGEKITEEKINLEEFMSYLDIDRHLKLHGSDYSAPEETFKNLIYSHEKSIADDEFILYEHFVERLGLHDSVFTFNYDTILEKALRRKNIPYRLYPFRHKYDERAKGLILDGKEELKIFKVHGSINWFDISQYQEQKDYLLQMNIEKNPSYAVFDGRMKGDVHRLLDEPFQPNDPFKDIYMVENLDKYFDIYFNRDDYSSFYDSPFIIAPSYQKLISLNILSDFWGGFFNVINIANRIVIIGFSLPAHDEYIRQTIYWYIKHFHEFGEPFIGTKSKLKVVDFKKDQKGIDEFKENYRFVDEKMTDFYFGGFCEEVLDSIFQDEG